MFKMLFICVQNSMDAILHFLKQLTFCYLLRFIIILDMELSLSFNVHVQSIGNQIIFAKKVVRKFWYWNREKVKKVSVLSQKKLSYKIKTCIPKYYIWKSIKLKSSLMSYLILKQNKSGSEEQILYRWRTR